MSHRCTDALRSGNTLCMAASPDSGRLLGSVRVGDQSMRRPLFDSSPPPSRAIALIAAHVLFISGLAVSCRVSAYVEQPPSQDVPPAATGANSTDRHDEVI